MKKTIDDLNKEIAKMQKTKEKYDGILHQAIGFVKNNHQA